MAEQREITNQTENFQGFPFSSVPFIPFVPSSLCIGATQTD
jgi:hypothetical protein